MTVCRLVFFQSLLFELLELTFVVYIPEFQVCVLMHVCNQ